MARRALAGHSAARLDIPDKVFAQPRFIHDTALPGLLHGRVMRPELSRAKLAGLDFSSVTSRSRAADRC